MSRVQKLLEQYHELSAEEQDLFKSQLVDGGVPDPPGEDITPEEWERVWGEEIVNRSERLKRGETTARDAFEALEDSRRKLREKYGT
jgi:hypothetical protein